MASLTLSGCTVDLGRRVVLTDGAVCSLTTKEAQLLRYLVARRGQAVSQEELLVEVWDYPASMATRTVYSTIRRLRSKIEREPSQPDHILTVHGAGYRFHGHPLQDETIAIPSPGSSMAPAYGDDFVGRQRELTDLLRRTQAPAFLISVVGPAGVGKTRIAAQVARDTSAIWVALATARDADRAMQLIADACGITPRRQHRMGECADRIAHYLGVHEKILVLDNTEQVGAEIASVLSAWQDQDLRVMCTSREAHRIRGEQVFELDVLPEADAIALFVRRSHAGKESDPTLPTLVAALDHLPLALELAAARTDLFAPATLLERQQEHLRLLKTRRRDVVHRQASLRSALDWSWDLLGEDERSALAQCSVFHGGFSMEAVEAVIHVADRDPLELVSQLKERSLLMVSSSAEPRLRLLKTVRAYAAEKLDDLSVRARHAAFYVNEAESWTAELRGLGRSAGLANLILETENLEAIADGETTHRVRAVLLLNALVRLRGPYARHLKRLEDGLQSPQRPDDRIVLHRFLGQTLERVGRPDDAVVAYEHSLAMAREVGDEAGAAEALICLAAVSSKSQQPRDCLRHASQARDLAGAHPGLVAKALSAMASANMELGDVDEAQRMLAEAVQAGHASKDNRLACQLQWQRAVFLTRTGNLIDAEADLRAIRQIAGRDGDVQWEAICVGALGPLSFKRGRLDETEVHYEEALALQQRMGDIPAQALAKANLGALAADTGRMEEARAILHDAIELARRCNAHPYLAFAQVSLCGLEMAMADMGAARAALTGAEMASAKVGPFRLSGFLETRRGQLAWIAGDLPAARDALARGADQLAAVHQPYWAALSGCFLAAVAADLGNHQTARAQLQESRSFFEGVGNARAVQMTELVEARMNGSDPGAIRAHDAPLCDARILQQVLARSPR